MVKNKFLIALYGCMTAVLLFVSSCNKVLDVSSKRMESEKDAWKSIDDTRSRLIGIYGLFRTALASNNNYWLWGELRHGDFQATSRNDLQAVIDGNLNASYPLLEEMRDWRPFYAVINAANLFIERSGAVEGLDPRYTTLNHEVDVAQARVLRAWAYFMMVRIWGDVPLITQSHDGSFAQLPRTSADRVLNFCEEDLNAAKDVLPFKYGIVDDPILPGNYYGYGIRRYLSSLVSRLSAYALLAHVSAWRGNYNNANVYAKFVLDNKSQSSFWDGSSNFTLDFIDTKTLTGPRGIFYERGNYKHLLGFNFVYMHGEAGTSGDGHLESWTLAAPLINKPTPDIFVPKPTINTVFKNPRDTRFGLDSISGLYKTAYFTNYTSETPVFSKIKVLENGASETSFQVYSSAIIFSRMEEIALLRAEALAAINQNEEAKDMLNIVRTRRGVGAYDPLTGGDLLDAIFAERRAELMGEGWRWYDQVRYQRLKRSDPNFVKLIDEGGIYWPIANSVLESNPAIVQNPYWLTKR